MLLQPYIDKRVCVITADGRVLFGTLRAFDNQTNLVLTDTVERIFQGDPVADAPSSEQKDDGERIAQQQAEHTYTGEGCIDDPVGVFLLRGENVAMIGEVDAELDRKRDWTAVVAPPLKGFRSWAS